MNKIALWIGVSSDDWTTERVITSSNGFVSITRNYRKTSLGN